MSDLKKYTLQFKYGIDDLVQETAYTGSWGQGDYYGSNDPTEPHPSYVSYNFGDVPQTKEDIEAEIRRRKLKNLAYIAELKASGKYGTTYDVNVSFKHHPLFDDPPANEPLEFKATKLMSHTMFMLDLNKDKPDETPGS